MYEKHGLSHSRLYSIWHGMRDRCYRPQHDAFRHYGARGIRVCEDWRSSFIAFHSWATDHGYRSDKSIDRIDPNGNYCPENCRWTTDKRQAWNRRTASNAVTVEFEGSKITVAELSRRTGVGYTTLRKRVASGCVGYDVWRTPQKVVDYSLSAIAETGNGMAKLRATDVAYIASSNVSGAELARRFGVSQALVSMIRSGQRRSR
jgi:hypothetical protein